MANHSWAATTAQQYSVNGSSSVTGNLTGETITHAAFSPDGKSLVFDDQSTNGNLLLLAQTNGSAVTVSTGGRLLVHGNAAIFPRVPSFSPDGTKIIFLYNQTGSDQIYTIKPDGTGQTQITTTLSGAIDNPAFTKAGNIRFITRGSGRYANQLQSDEPRWQRPDHDHHVLARRRALVHVQPGRHEDRLHRAGKRQNRRIHHECRRLRPDANNKIGRDRYGQCPFQRG